MITKHALPILFGLVVLTAAGVYWQARAQDAKYATLNDKFDTQVELLASTTASLSRSITLLSDEIAKTQSQSSAVAAGLATEQANVSAFQNRIETIGNKVGTLDKLSKIDPELLKKYSKVYFLNEHYIPEHLASIDPKYLYHNATVT